MGVAKKKAPARGTQRAEANPQEALHGGAQPDGNTTSGYPSMTGWIAKLMEAREALMFQSFRPAIRIIDSIIEEMRREADDGR